MGQGKDCVPNLWKEGKKKVGKNPSHNHPTSDFRSLETKEEGVIWGPSERCSPPPRGEKAKQKDTIKPWVSLGL